MLEIGMICAEAGEKKTGWLEQKAADRNFR